MVADAGFGGFKRDRGGTAGRPEDHWTGIIKQFRLYFLYKFGNYAI